MSKWRKVKLAIGFKFNSCLYVPNTIDDSPPPPPRLSAAVKIPTTPTPSSSALRSPKNFSKSSESEKLCPICHESMAPSNGHRIFDAECSHSFHLDCITSNVMHGSKICPVCRAKWKKIPFPTSATDDSHGGDSARTRGVRPVNRQIASPIYIAEPPVFDDDDEVVSSSDNKPSINSNISSSIIDNDSSQSVEVKTFPEVSVVPKSKSYRDFHILIHLKAPPEINGSSSSSTTSRAPIDLVTVLDVSGSMAGTKLALLKRAMGFVIQNLDSTDRLSVIAFSNTSRRLFPLRRMTDIGKHEALQAVNSLSSGGGTFIAEALRKSAKVMIERKWKNPVSNVILLSDGQDTDTDKISRESLLPFSMHRSNISGLHIPVHAFGFGGDHDAVSMHKISQLSGGTFSFIEAESVIQDAFAQCIGGLLSVVVQELKVVIECVDCSVKLTSIKSGSYKSNVSSDERNGFIEVGDMYAEEERDFLVTMDIPISISQYNDESLSLVKVGCIYKNPISKHLISQDLANDVKIQRPILGGGAVEVSMEVDKQKNRVRAAEAMAEASAAAEVGELGSAVSILEKYRKKLLETASAKAKDSLCVSLDAELNEMQTRMGNRQTYERSGRAYMFSGMSSHSWQRSTARGDSTDSTSVLHAYQTPSMVDMVSMSQSLVLDNRPPRPNITPSSLSMPMPFPARIRPR